MAKRSDTVIGSVIMLILVGGFALFWIGTAARLGAPFIFPLFGIVFFGFAVVTLGRTVFRTMEERTRNEAAPVLTSRARVTAKRTEVSRQGKSHTTSYYATFELASGERRELEMNGDEYGLIAEGDRGELRCQGTWYLGFTRQVQGVNAEPMPVVTRPQMLACAYCGSAIPAPKLKCESCGWTWRPVVEVRAGAESRG